MKGTAAETPTGRTDPGAYAGRTQRDDQTAESALDELAEGEMAGGATLSCAGAMAQFFHRASTASLNGRKDFGLGDLQAATDDALGRQRVGRLGSTGSNDGRSDGFHKASADRAAGRRERWGAVLKIVGQGSDS